MSPKAQMLSQLRGQGCPRHEVCSEGAGDEHIEARRYPRYEFFLYYLSGNQF
jgi:hypothetical protein